MQDEKPDKMSFDFDDGAGWKPFNLNKSLFDDFLPSIQPAILEYRDVDVKLVGELEQNIERMIVARFEEWRKGQVTRWNR
jgi:hypothetical protein